MVVKEALGAFEGGRAGRWVVLRKQQIVLKCTCLVWLVNLTEGAAHTIGSLCDAAVNMCCNCCVNAAAKRSAMLARNDSEGQAGYVAAEVCHT